ncbi:class I tRNA ligase family protein [Patescibacteria group bacterium]|nr:class I tRNA ligase family protein [Patescibacteria group bacterium]MBU2010284.1 class I tRNA ligase family protein [Patescibacteria group bacterium]
MKNNIQGEQSKKLNKLVQKSDGTNNKNNNVTTNTAQRECDTLAFWRENNIFEKTLEKTKKGKLFIFYDGPPFATGLPHYGHLLAGTMKDVIPRYQTMKGRYVRRKWGWDCHGLPLENMIEAELKLENKQDIEKYGIEKFNEAARSSVLRYDKDWKKIVPRMGRFVDMEDSYKTMDWQYSESIWWAFKQLYDKGLIYKGHKSMHLCPRCETTLSNNEVADGYKDIKDISVIAKFELLPRTTLGKITENEILSEAETSRTFVLAWTTTPWTLPGNVALAVGEEIIYSKIEIGNDIFIIAKERLEVIKEEYKILGEITGKELVGKSYKPLFDYYTKDEKLENCQNGWKIYDADFVNTEDGTGVVHIAPAFGEDDMEIGAREKLPFIQHVATNGVFKEEVLDFAGMPVKPKNDHMSADIEIIKHLARHNLLFSKEKIEHSYPHCWRCKTPLLNYAADSWFVNVVELKEKLIKENNQIKWIPQAIGSARFGNWLEGARDWAISRSRYWGASFPVWECSKCNKIDIVGSIDELSAKLPKSNNSYIVMRHGQAESNIRNYISNNPQNNDHLTALGKEQTKTAAKKLGKEKIDIIFASDFIRTKETAKIVANAIGIDKTKIIYDKRLWEVQTGDFNKKPTEDYHRYFINIEERFTKNTPNGENLTEMKNRVMEFLYEIDKKYKNKKILIVTHAYVVWLLNAGAKGFNAQEASRIKDEKKGDFFTNAEIRKLDFTPTPHNRNYETDLHRPYIDEVIYLCDCGGEMKRIPDVFDCWFESGSMPYAQFHYPFENREEFQNNFPADFIAEGLDQTRGWFYSLLVLSVGLFDITSYKNVIVNGMILAEDGQKMSKSERNYPDPMSIVEKYGADALRYYLMSSPSVRAEALNFSEKGVSEVSRKIIARLLNVLSFYEMYASRKEKSILPTDSTNILDIWILARLRELVDKVTTSLDLYELDKATRPIGDFIDDLSTWYLRRSRGRFKSDDIKDRDFALATTQNVLLELAKVIAPTMPFVAEYVFRAVRTEKDEESIHLTDWPCVTPETTKEKDVKEQMTTIRDIVSLALEARANVEIKVRQPLSALTLKSAKLKGKENMLELIKDEVNVQIISFDKNITEEVALDITITPELKKAGQFRELVRHIQQMRKTTGLTPDDMVTLTVKTDTEGKKLVEQFSSELHKTTLLKEIIFKEVSSANENENEKENGALEIKIDDLIFQISLKK